MRPQKEYIKFSGDGGVDRSQGALIFAIILCRTVASLTLARAKHTPQTPAGLTTTENYLDHHRLNPKIQIPHCIFPLCMFILSFFLCWFLFLSGWMFVEVAKMSVLIRKIHTESAK